MLSRVLKGDRARQLQPMAFAQAQHAALAPEFSTPARVPQPPVNPAHEGELNDRIRALEDALAATKREAFEAGRQQGEQAARAAIEPVLERMNAAIAAILNMRPELRRRAEKDAVELALKIARRVLHRELNTDPSALNALARVVFDRLTRAETWRLTVHPQFADAIRGSLPGSNIGKVIIDADSSCAPGTFVLRSSEGTIDASVDAQLIEIDRGLTDRLARV